MAVVARAAWILNSFGVSNVKIMLGGLQGWMQAGFKAEEDEEKSWEKIQQPEEYELVQTDRVVTDIEKVYE